MAGIVLAVRVGKVHIKQCGVLCAVVTCDTEFGCIK